MKTALTALKENGFIISRESPCCEVRNDLFPDVTIVTTHRTPSETILLLRKDSQRRKTRYIEINSDDFSWLPKVQGILSRNSHEDLVLYSEDPTSGILGMVKCLRKEYGSEKVRCVFIMDESEKFNPNSRTYSDQLRKNVAFNVYKNSQWGTFRHLPLDDSNVVKSEQCFVNVVRKGELLSLKWIEGTLTHHTMPEPEKNLIYVMVEFH